MGSERLGTFKQLTCMIAHEDFINFRAYMNEKLVFIMLMSKNIIWNSYIVHLESPPPHKKDSMVPLKHCKVQYTTYRTLY
jgi:hypothetical protein